MAYVITEACIGVKDRSCMAVCPCDCIHEGVFSANGKIYDMMFIDPGECIDCGLCEPECPVEAIYLDVDLPKSQSHFVRLNAGFSGRSGPDMDAD